MSEWERFRQKLVVAVPEGEQLPARRFMVGVLIAGRDPNSELDHRDFKWIKAHGRITVGKIRETYLARENNADIDLCVDGDIVPLNTMMKDLGKFDDPYIAFRAVEKRVPRAALALRSPSNAKIPTQPPTSAPTKSQAPPFTFSADKDVNLPPRDALRDTEQPSIQNSARPLHFTRVNSTPLSDVPSTLFGDNTPERYVPFPHQTPTSLSPYAPAQPVGMPSASAPAEGGAHLKDNLASESNAQLRLESRTPPHMMVKTERSSPARSPIPEDAPLSQNFNVDDVFRRDASPEVDLEKHTQLLDHHIRQVAQRKEVEVLEAGVERATRILDQLKETFSQFAAVCPDAKQWIDSIDKTKERSNGSRTILGVVGNTGAGKSSVINALLDEERLVPTNCMRACTAVVTEISWNTNDGPDQKYRAEIEFIDRADWEKDLKILMQEFLTENGAMTREASDPNSDAGIAWAKFHAVYPRIHKDELENCTVEKLMDENAVLKVLGTTKLINRARVEPFYAELQKFVDSKEKVTGKKDKEQQKQQRNQMEYWPLIKVVRLYVKSEALSTGAVIVDLPGVHDSNAARAAVAERYIQQCSGLWIVAPITRAVDDKAAKNLLGENFKRQLKYDGNYSAVTFICSKTDDISITEAIDSLQLDEEVRELETKMHAYEQELKETEEKIADLNESADVYRVTFHEVDEEIDTWEDLKDRVETETVFAPKREKNQKRKKSESKSDNRSRKRRQIQEDSDVEYIESGSDNASESEHESDTDVEVPQEPLTMQNVEQKLADLKSTKKNARQEKKAAEDNIKELKPTIRATKTKIADIAAQIRAICIDGRNKYSKGAIQLDFAAGIKELDQEAAVEVDEDAFNPDQELRDYDEVASSLPVFCVSSRAYQKLCGRLKKDATVPGFRTKEETEVPQLKNHCQKLTEGGRILNCRSFLINFCSTLTAFFLWASNDGTGPELTHADKSKQAIYLTDTLEKLGKGLEQAVEVCLHSMKKQLREQIFVRMQELVHDAIQSAPTIAESWGRHKNEGGVHWCTYKAIVRRGGVYHSASAGHRDFNAELLGPIMNKLGTSWERAFAKRLPKVFGAYTKNSASILHAFHARVEERARQNGVGLAHMAMLKGSIYNYEQAFQNLDAQLKIKMQDAQRDANREFVPTLASIMMQVYDICSRECGTGSFARMKNNMVTFVQQHSPNMFQDATQAVETALLAMCRRLEEEMSNEVDKIRSTMHNDYMHVLLGVQVAPDVMNKSERALRAEVMAQLKQIDPQFERIAKGELTEPFDSTGQPSEDTRAGADIEAEQQLHFEANDTSNNVPDDVSTSPAAKDQTTTNAPTSRSHAPRKPSKASKKRLVVDTTDDSEDGEL